MPNDIAKLRRIMRQANYLKKQNPVILRGNAIGNSRALKYAWWFEDFRAKLRTGTYRFSYFKKDGSIREAVGTLKWDLIPDEHHPKSGMDSEALAPSNSFCYYDLYANGDTGGWRSFSIDLFIGFVEQVG
jgi:hypothetical protein